MLNELRQCITINSLYQYHRRASVIKTILVICRKSRTKILLTISIKIRESFFLIALWFSLDLNSCVIRFLNCLTWPSVPLNKIYTAVCSVLNLEKQMADLHDCTFCNFILLFAPCQEKNLGSCTAAKAGYLI